MFRLAKQELCLKVGSQAGAWEPEDVLHLMKTDKIAIIVSFFSIVIAALSLGWNIYRDIILRARLKVSYGIGKLFGIQTKGQDKINLSIVNMGPGLSNCAMIEWRNTGLLKRILRKSTKGFIIHDYANPLNGKLPCKLEVGESVNFFFPIDKDCHLAQGITHIGIRDSLGRIFWAPRKEVRKAIKLYEKEFRNSE